MRPGLTHDLWRTRTIFRGFAFEAAAISLCSGLRDCLPPRSFPPLQIPLQGGRGFYVRAERASLPSHASDILSARLQAIGGARTFTSLDSQHCRLLLMSTNPFPRCPSPYPGGLLSAFAWFFLSIHRKRAIPLCSCPRIANSRFRYSTKTYVDQSGRIGISQLRQAAKARHDFLPDR
jgi:hypothetical protein